MSEANLPYWLVFAHKGVLMYKIWIYKLDKVRRKVEHTSNDRS